MFNSRAASQIWKILCASLLLSALACCERQQASKAVHDAIEAEPATKEVLKTNRAFERIPVSTNSTIQEDGAKKEPIVIWRSSRSTPQERADAANRMLPSTATISDARAVLGHGSSLSHHFGPSLANSNGVDFWLLGYDVPNGRVVLRFSSPPAGTRPFFKEAYEDRATR